MHNASYQSVRPPVRDPHTGTTPGTPRHSDLIRFILRYTIYVIYFLFIVIDGLRNPISYDSRFLTLPYLVGGFALTRSIAEALTHHHDLHAALFAFGLSMLAMLA